MREITKETIRRIYMCASKRISFESYHLPTRTKKGDSYGIIILPFGNGISLLFPEKLETTDYASEVLRKIQTKEEFDRIKKWCEERKGYIYILTCMTCVAALGLNKSNPKKAEYTPIGLLVDNAREHKDTRAISRLIVLACEFIKKHPPFGECDFVAAVPASQDKPYDLPKILAAKIAAKIGKEDITAGFSYAGEKKKVKDVAYDPKDKNKCFEEKWALLKTAKMCYKGISVNGKSVLLIDDLYQSGTTMQYTAMVLRNNGAKAVFGLAMEKSMSDKGN